MEESNHFSKLPVACPINQQSAAAAPFVHGLSKEAGMTTLKRRSGRVFFGLGKRQIRMRTEVSGASRQTPFL